LPADHEAGGAALRTGARDRYARDLALELIDEVGVMCGVELRATELLLRGAELALLLFLPQRRDHDALQHDRVARQHEILRDCAALQRDLLLAGLEANESCRDGDGFAVHARRRNRERVPPIVLRERSHATGNEHAGIRERTPRLVQDSSADRGRALRRCHCWQQRDRAHGGENRTKMTSHSSSLLPRTGGRVYLRW